jgi:hypothetical protein
MTPRGATSKFRPWRFVVISLAAIVISVPIAFGSSTPTAGYVHWRGVVISLITAFCCAVCFFLSPRRPIAPKLAALALPILPLLSFVLCGCSTTPKLTAEDRKQDIEYLARWARDCSPVTALGEKYKGFPNCEGLKPKYLQLAEGAASNEEFYLITSAYYNVIGGGTCHFHLLPEFHLKWSAIGGCFGMYDWGLSTRQLWAGAYWPKVAAGVSTRAHPPFRIAAKAGRYYVEENYQSSGQTVPRGSEITQVNGMSCASYLGWLKTNTSLRYEAFPQDWADNYLLVVDEGPAHRGWSVGFELADGTRAESFVPKIPGFPRSKNPHHSTDAKENCTCLELTDTVAYIRIKNMWHGPQSYVFKGYIKRERQQIREFLEQREGRYTKLIIDVRDNGGGAPEYVYETLICPFLKEPVTFKQTAGVREKYLQETKASALRDFRKQYDLHVTETRKVKAPAEFFGAGWVWYEITREIRPVERYDFKGKLYVLINGGCGSAGDDYADLVKRLRLGTLVGQNTCGGGGAYLAPGVIRLPRSGMVLRAETEILISPDGSVDELFGTAPDVRLPPAGRPASITREDLLKDEWIKHVMTKL